MLIGDRKLTEGASWPRLFDPLTADRPGQLRDLYDALPHPARARPGTTAGGPALIGALGRTGQLQLAFGALLTVGLAVRF